MMTELDLTARTDTPTVIEGDAEADRWTKYGHDRVYVDGPAIDVAFGHKVNPYIDLETGTLDLDANLNNPPEHHVDVEDGVATIYKNGDVVVRVRLFESDDADDGAPAETSVDATVEPEDPQMEYRLVRDVRDGIDRVIAVRQLRPPKTLPGQISDDLDCVERMMDGFVVDDVERFAAYAAEHDIQVVDAR